MTAEKRHRVRQFITVLSPVTTGGLAIRAGAGCADACRLGEAAADNIPAAQSIAKKRNVIGVSPSWLKAFAASLSGFNDEAAFRRETGRAAGR